MTSARSTIISTMLDARGMPRLSTVRDVLLCQHELSCMATDLPLEVVQFGVAVKEVRERERSLYGFRESQPAEGVVHLVVLFVGNISTNDATPRRSRCLAANPGSSLRAHKTDESAPKGRSRTRCSNDDALTKRGDASELSDRPRARFLLRGRRGGRSRWLAGRRTHIDLCRNRSSGRDGDVERLGDVKALRTARRLNVKTVDERFGRSTGR